MENNLDFIAMGARDTLHRLKYVYALVFLLAFLFLRFCFGEDMVRRYGSKALVVGRFADVRLTEEDKLILKKLAELDKYDESHFSRINKCTTIIEVHEILNCTLTPVVSPPLAKLCVYVLEGVLLGLFFLFVVELFLEDAFAKSIGAPNCNSMLPALAAQGFDCYTRADIYLGSNCSGYNDRIWCYRKLSETESTLSKMPFLIGAMLMRIMETTLQNLPGDIRDRVHQRGHLFSIYFLILTMTLWCLLVFTGPALSDITAVRTVQKCSAYLVVYFTANIATSMVFARWVVIFNAIKMTAHIASTAPNDQVEEFEALFATRRDLETPDPLFTVKRITDKAKEVKQDREKEQQHHLYLLIIPFPIALISVSPLWHWHALKGFAVLLFIRICCDAREANALSISQNLRTWALATVFSADINREPDIATISFRYNVDRWYWVEAMIQLGYSVRSDVHFRSQLLSYKPLRLPSTWENKFGSTRAWQVLTDKHFTRELNDEGLSAPASFVRWAVAAEQSKVVLVVDERRTLEQLEQACKKCRRSDLFSCLSVKWPNCDKNLAEPSWWQMEQLFALCLWECGYNVKWDTVGVKDNCCGL